MLQWIRKDISSCSALFSQNFLLDRCNIDENVAIASAGEHQTRFTVRANSVVDWDQSLVLIKGTNFEGFAPTCWGTAPDPVLASALHLRLSKFYMGHVFLLNYAQNVGCSIFCQNLLVNLWILLGKTHSDDGSLQRCWVSPLITVQKECVIFYPRKPEHFLALSIHFGFLIPDWICNHCCRISRDSN